jgi:outer membrane cobalamin receptor
MKDRIRVVLTLFTLLFGASVLEAQERARIQGRVTGPDGEPVRGASVLARSIADTTRVSSALTQQDGSFRLEVAPGSYLLRITHLGFEPHAQQLSLGADAPLADLGAIRLATTAVAVEGVTVEAQRSTVEMTADRTIYRTRDMPALQGSVATDALRGVPELDVDLEGRVTLRGATPRIHINGRPTPMQGEALQQFLQQLPSERIDRIEVVPNPSARYEAEGAGGIVNIVLKSNTGLGLSGSLGLTAGTRGQTGGFGNLAYQEGRLTLFGNGSLNFHERTSTSYDFRENLLADPPTFLLQEGGWGNKGYFRRADVSAEFRLGERSHLWSSVSGGGFGSDSDGSTDFTIMDAARTPTERYTRVSTSNWSRSNADASLGYKHTIEEGRHELSFEVRHSRAGGGNDGRFLRQPLEVGGDPLDLPSELMTNDTDEDERRTWLKADYERPFGETRVQIGYQANLQRTEHDQLRETFSAESATVPVGTARNAFRYDESFHQAYVTASRKLGKLSLQAGLRAEQAQTEFHLPTTGEAFDNEYTSFFPNANLAYELSERYRLGLNYSRRVQRPWIWYLNPVDWSVDPMTRRVGNPRLQPQYTHSFGGNVSWSGQRGTLRLAPYFRSTENDWGQITHADSTGVLTTTWENVASLRSYGANVSAMLRSTGRVSGNVGVGGHREVRNASNLSQDYSGAYFRYNANANLMVTAPGALTLQTMLWYNSPQELPQGRRSAFVMSSIGARKQLLQRKATVNLRVEDPFELARFNFETRDRTHVQIARNNWSMRSVSLNVSYNFGRRPRSVRRPSGEEMQPQQPDPTMGMPPG